MNLTMNNVLQFKENFNNNKSLIAYINHALLGFYLFQSRRYQCHRFNSARLNHRIRC